ncbi:hypothetical protein ACGFH8_20450 [Micromonospora sp. NPDC049175]|uniref:hypothetical protein n=1 Tax=Micromonospora sp. NPDC049175 TaxID=3364266 RepID=UPI003724C257
MATRQPVRQSWTPAVLVIVLALVIAVPTVAIEVGFRRMATDGRAEQARAEADVTRFTQAYADAVVADGDPAPTDDRLAAVAEDARVQVREVRRLPDLTVIVYGEALFSRMYSVSRSDVCHRVTFHDLGTAAAGSVAERLADCPPPVPGPTPS